MRCLRGYWKFSAAAIKSIRGEAMRCLRGYWKMNGLIGDAKAASCGGGS